MSSKTLHWRSFTKLEKRWILYDVANSAITLLFTTLMPLYFNSIAEAAEIAPNDYLAYWGYAIGLCTAIVAILGPIMGTVGDRNNAKKRLFLLSLIFGSLALLALTIQISWLSFLILFVIARVGYQMSLIFYDSMLPDIASSQESMDHVSTYGYALGYIGSVVPFILSLLVVLGNETIGISSRTAMAIAIAINVVWWVVFSIPILRSYKQKHHAEGPSQVRNTFAHLGETLRVILKTPRLTYFLLAFFFYIDGVYTIIDMAVAYGGSLGLDSASLLLALLLTQVVAFPSAIAFSILLKKFNSDRLITIAIIGYAAIAGFAVQLDQEWEFWVLAVAVGLFQGGIQALSRSHFARLIPADKSGSFFGIYDIFGKGAAFMGTTLVAFISQVTGVQNYGIVAIFVIFLIGLFLFRLSLKQPEVVYNEE